MEYTMDREEIVNKLKQGLLEVTFNKVNGDERVMTCTLQEGVIPAATKKDPLSLKKVREVNPEVVSVWDTNATGWRSFRVVNVTDVNEVA
tara:strand:+ start:89 stop:358 length:270 start_codon:yes stop_codon:yes gene_type:complete